MNNLIHVYRNITTVCDACFGSKVFGLILPIDGVDKNKLHKSE